MWIHSLLIGAFGFAFVPALAVADAAEPSQFRTITVQAGQGGAITLDVPTTPNGKATQYPYALTGPGAVERHHRLVPMRFGQGNILLVEVPD